MKHKSIIAINLFLMALISFVIVCGCSKKEVGWPQWRGPNGDGISTETDWDPEALADGPKILWQVDVGLGYSNVVIKNNRLYTLARRPDCFVICVNAETGEEIWSHYLETRTEPYSTPTIDGRFVYATDNNGVTVCLYAKSGRLRWKRDLVRDFGSAKKEYGYAASPVINGNLVILNAKTSGIALNKQSGEKVWQGEVNVDRIGAYYATPVIYDYDDERFVLLFSNTGLYSVKVESGGLAWFYEWTKEGSNNIADPVVFGKRVFISSSAENAQGVLLDIEGNNPREIWQSDNLNNHISTSIYIDGFLYGNHGTYPPSERNNSLRCVNAETGEVMWKENMEGAALVLADGKLIILEANGTLRIAEATPSKYSEISSCKLPSESGKHNWWTPPVLYRGKIYCRNWIGDLVCIDVSKKS